MFFPLEKTMHVTLRNVKVFFECTVCVLRCIALNLELTYHLLPPFHSQRLLYNSLGAKSGSSDNSCGGLHSTFLIDFYYKLGK